MLYPSFFIHPQLFFLRQGAHSHCLDIDPRANLFQHRRRLFTSAMCTKFQMVSQHKNKELLSLGRAIPFDATLRFWMKGHNCWKDCTLKNIRLNNCKKKTSVQMSSHLHFRFVGASESFSEDISFYWRKPALGFQRPTWDVKIPLATKRDIYHINRWDGFPNHQQYGKIWVLMKLMRHFLKCFTRIQKP